MKLSKFLLLLVFFTLFSLFYIFQQTEIFRLAYEGQKKQASFQELLDKNTILRYNIAKQASLVHIGDRIKKSADFQMPDNYRLVKLPYNLEDTKISQYNSKKENLVMQFFGIKHEASANTIGINNQSTK